jgi:hypothetical protein
MQKLVSQIRARVVWKNGFLRQANFGGVDQNVKDCEEQEDEIGSPGNDRPSKEESGEKQCGAEMNQAMKQIA